MGNVSQDTRAGPCLGLAMAAEWRRIYPLQPAACLARDIGITKKAAENLLDGHFSSTSMGRIIAAFGPGWVAERVLEAAGTNLEAHIEKQVAEAERAAAIARERAREAGNRLERYRAACRREGGEGADLDV